MKQLSQTPTHLNPTSSGPATMTEAARRAWSVDFVVPKPDDMPSERLKARAELVRSALTCGGSTY